VTARVVPDGDAGRTAAIEVLRAGGVVAIPTDTVYGLAVSPALAGGLERLHVAKGRPADRRIAVLCASAGQAAGLVELPPQAERLAGAFWPGGLTLVLRARPGALPPAYPPDAATLGVRVPAHACPRAIAEALGPLPTTSANLSGRPEARDADEIVALFGDVLDLVVDGGPAPGGPASTVVDATGIDAVVLRAGAVPPERIEAALRVGR
jgi:L-threonylcarbamoyladenylate synthase